MSEPKVESHVEIRQFTGLVTNADPLDLPPGATTEQVNMTNQTPGSLTVREGMQELAFEN